jgi:hypothetical protein
MIYARGAALGMAHLTLLVMRARLRMAADGYSGGR